MNAAFAVGISLLLAIGGGGHFTEMQHLLGVFYYCWQLLGGHFTGMQHLLGIILLLLGVGNPAHLGQSDHFFFDLAYLLPPDQGSVPGLASGCASSTIPKCLFGPVAPAIPKTVIGVPGEGQVTCSELDHSICI